MMQFLTEVGDFLWGYYTPIVLLFAGLLFTIWTRFSQYTAMTHGVQVVRGLYDDPADPGAINHFQALSAVGHGAYVVLPTPATEHPPATRFPGTRNTGQGTRGEVGARNLDSVSEPATIS